MLKRPDFSPTQPWRAETRLVPSKAADLRLTLVSHFTSYLSRFLRATRERRWRTVSASCSINRSLRHTSCTSGSLRDAVSGLPLSGSRADSSSVAGDARADHGHIGDRPPNHHTRPNEIRQWVDARTHLPRILRDGCEFEVRSSRFWELRTPNFELRIAPFRACLALHPPTVHGHWLTVSASC